jgi:hypothetical protein
VKIIIIIIIIIIIYIYILKKKIKKFTWPCDQVLSKKPEFWHQKQAKMVASKAPIINLLLLLPSYSSHRNSNTINSNAKHLKPILKTPLPNRRLFLFSLSLPTLLLQPTSCYALPSFDPVTSTEREASAAISRRVSEAVDLLDKGRELQAKGDFNQALGYYTQVPALRSLLLCFSLVFEMFLSNQTEF